MLPADRAVRVLAFGDYGTGSPLQKQAAAAIAAYHRAQETIRKPPASTPVK